MQLIFKTTPRCFAWYINPSTFGTLVLTPNLLQNYKNIKNLFEDIKFKFKICFVGFENPHIDITSQKPLLTTIKEIQQIQRTIGVTQVLAFEVFGITPNSLVHTTKLSVPDKLALTNKTCCEALKTEFYSDLEKLCLAECIMLMDDINTTHVITARVIND